MSNTQNFKLIKLENDIKAFSLPQLNKKYFTDYEFLKILFAKFNTTFASF
jgi:hypothetical protein